MGLFLYPELFLEHVIKTINSYIFLFIISYNNKKKEPCLNQFEPTNEN